MLQTGPLSAVLAEEIALEGLEGTTLDTLWNHLAIRLKIKMPAPQKFCNSVWSMVVQNSEYMFFTLPEPRKPYVFFDRMEQVDPTTGVMKEPKEYPGHRFKYNPVTANGIRGSCECYETRQVVSREELIAISYLDVENRWPNMFVIVASQKMRESTIIEPNCTSELSIIQYCMLEWIARSRYNGETSQGKFSLVELTKDSSILYYNRKFLTDCKLITRQALCQRTGETSIQGMVYHLPRYYCEMKPKALMITEKVFNLLKTRPNHMADYEEVKLIVLGRAEARKWFRTNEFTKFIRTDETVSYRTLYPEAEPREYMLKNKRNEEKQIRVMRLIDPEADVYDLWYKEEQPEEEQKDGFLDSQKAYIDMPVLQQAYNVIANSGEQGISQSVLAVQMGLDRLNARALVKNLMRIKAVEGYAVDEGRQRTTKYFLPGMNQRNVTFDKEAIQLMSSHHLLSANGQEQLPQQQVSQQQDSVQQPPQLPPSIPLMASTSGTASLSESSSYDTTLEQDHLDEEDEERYKMHLNLYSQANTTVLDAIDVQIFISDEVVGLKKNLGGISTMNSKHISAKVLKRCNLILELLKTYQVVEPREVLKKINKDEREKGFKAEACHKSVLRLIGRLAADRFLRVANVKLTKEDRVINVTYACDMSVDESTPSLKGKIEAAKARMMMSVVGQVAVKKLVEESEPLTAAIGTSYEGTLAKCLRMRLFHEFLFYLIYELSPDAQELRGAELDQMDLSFVQEDLGPVYFGETGWKMFVPPLNVYESYGQGWALVTDVTLRLPLSVFCQICTFGFYTKELDYWMNHPVRQHMLVKQLPKHIRLQLFRQRKYIFNIYELCQKLCYAGLLQFGPQRMKDRDQTFIYINRTTALLDTRESAIGYHEVEDKTYPMRTFQLDCMDDLHAYWENLYKIALGTRLNRRSAAFGKEILVQQLHVKPEIVEACKARTPEQAVEYDVPKLPPGDNRGAAGMDTAMFVHLKSNWSKVMNYAPAVKNHLAKLKRLKTMKKIAQLHKPTTSRATISSKRIMSTGKEKKLCLKAKLSVKPFASSYKRYNDKKHTIKVRKIEKRKGSKRKKAHYDDVDRQALKLMDKLRVDWSPNEDTVLLLCRIGLRYLYGEVINSSTIINSSVYRDILHWTSPESLNKTSRACQRRINYMIKQKPGVAANVKLCVEEARLNPVIEQRFGNNFISRLRTFFVSGEDMAMALKIHFVELVFLLRNTLTKLKMTEGFRPMEGLKRPTQSQFIPDTIEEFEHRYNILQEYDKPEQLNFKANPTNSEDIIIFKLAILIHSAVVTARGKGTLSIQLFNIYKNYSEKHLAAAMKLIRSFRLISLSRKLKIYTEGAKTVMPSLGDDPYHISITYLNQISTKIPFQMFSHVYTHYISLLDRPNYEHPMAIDDVQQGLVLLLGELVSANLADIELESLGDPELKSVNSDLRDDFGSDFSTLAQAADMRAEQALEGPAKRIKTEPRSVHKVRFATTNDVFFNYIMHPVERLTKIPSEYLHFFCVLESLRNGTLLRTFKIDESCNFCSIENCILQSSDRNIIQRCINIALHNRDIIERIKANRTSRVDMTPLLVLREDNIAQYFMRIIKEYGRLNVAYQKRDFGTIPEGMKSSINMVDLVYDIVQFDNVPDFNWLDRYEVTQLEDDNGNALTLDGEGNEPEYSRDRGGSEHDLPDRAVPVSFMRINVRLAYNDPVDLRVRVNLDNRLIPKIFLPEKFSERHEVLNKITNDTLWPSRDQLVPLLEVATPLIYQNPRLSAVAMFIEGTAELGATVLQLGEQFRNHADLLHDLQVLLNFKFILRTGFRHITYVHWQYVQPWLLRTSCIVRDEPKQDSGGLLSSVCVKQEPGTSHPKRTLPQSSDDEDDDLIDVDEMDEFAPPPKNRRDELQRKIAVMEERDRLKPKKNLSLAMTPWIKINGGIDRRLMYRWLTTLLLYCMSHPGVQLSVIYSRFNMMAPVHLYYLLEILQGYGCLHMYSMEVRQKRSLFSTYRPPRVDPATEFDREECSYIEATANALSTLSVFIGDYSKFQQDFLAPVKPPEPQDGEMSDA